MPTTVLASQQVPGEERDHCVHIHNSVASFFGRQSHQRRLCSEFRIDARSVATLFLQQSHPYRPIRFRQYTKRYLSQHFSNSVSPVADEIDPHLSPSPSRYTVSTIHSERNRHQALSTTVRQFVVETLRMEDFAKAAQIVQ
jgi:hypothetical protein